MSVIKVENVSKCFYLQPERPRSFQDMVVNAFRRKGRASTREALWAVKDVSFALDAGQTLGIIGSNGSGKSTCLKLLTRILEPTTGQVTVEGRVSALLELGAGFHPELTGRENVFLHGSVLGLSRREVTERLDDIVAFAELERFIDIPVKVYSSGMYVRLAFAAAINVSPDILLVDEVLAVGDQSFQNKCLARIHEMKSQGVTILFVSHDLNSVKALCDRVIWLDKGTIRERGAADTIVAHYLARVYDAEGIPASEGDPGMAQASVSDEGQEGTALSAPGPETAQAVAETESDPIARQRGRWGSREAEIVDVSFLNQANAEAQTLHTNAPMTVVITYQAHERIENPVFGIAIHQSDGTHISGTNTFTARFDIPCIEGWGKILYRVDALPLLGGLYYLSVAIHSTDETRFFDYHNLFYPFRVELGKATPHQGIIHVPARWEHLPNPENVGEGTSK